MSQLAKVKKNGSTDFRVGRLGRRARLDRFDETPAENCGQSGVVVVEILLKQRDDTVIPGKM